MNASSLVSEPKPETRFRCEFLSLRARLSRHGPDGGPDDHGPAPPAEVDRAGPVCLRRRSVDEHMLEPLAGRQAEPQSGPGGRWKDEARLDGPPGPNDRVAHRPEARRRATHTDRAPVR